MSRSEKEVHRLWDEYKGKAEKGLDWNEGYRCVIRALLKLGDVKGAREVYGEWEESQGREFDARIPGLLISRYCEEDDHVKLSDVVNSSRQMLQRRQMKMFKKDLGFAFLVAVTVPPMIWGLSLDLNLSIIGCLALIVYTLITW